MPLTCFCEWEPEPGDTLWDFPGDYETLERYRRPRCCSCGELIDLGSIVVRCIRWKVPDSDIECKIYGEDGEIELADKFMCEVCSDLFFSLHELGFCVFPGENMKELVKEFS